MWIVWIIYWVSQIYDKENEVKFISYSCTITKVNTSEVILVALKCKNMYVVDLDSIYGEDLKCLNVVENDDDLWRKRAGKHELFTTQ